jgi:ABC-type Fe3+-siderophore transport system permease subunit
MRFVKAFLSGAITSLGLITVADISTWTELRSALSAIALSALMGGINGILMASEKYLNWQDEPTTLLG